MRVRVSPRLVPYLVLGGGGLLLALLLGRPEPAALGLPFLAAALVGVLTAEAPELRASAELSAERVVEGEAVDLELEVTSGREVPWLQAQVALPAGLDVEQGEPLGWHLDRGRPRRLHLRLRTTRWGVHPVGDLLLRARDGLGFFAFESVLPCDRVLRVYPREETLRRAIRPRETQAFLGNEVARAAGEGIEFAGVRPYLPGDRVRRINWRLSSRRRDLHVNEMHPERNADVVLFLDTFSALRGGDGAEEDALVLAVRAAAGLARYYLARRDRVGLIGFGGVLRWLLPSMGARQLATIVEALLDTEVTLSYAWKGIEVIPPRTLPPRALVVALSPLLDQRTVTALLDLRHRGFDLSVIEIPAEALVPAGRRPEARLAHRIWRLARERQRADYLRLGVPVVVWPPGEPLAPVLEEAERYRRSVRVWR